MFTGFKACIQLKQNLEVFSLPGFKNKALWREILQQGVSAAPEAFAD